MSIKVQQPGGNYFDGDSDAKIIQTGDVEAEKLSNMSAHDYVKTLSNSGDWGGYTWTIPSNEEDEDNGNQDNETTQTTTGSWSGFTWTPSETEPEPETSQPEETQPETEDSGWSGYTWEGKDDEDDSDAGNNGSTGSGKYGTEWTDSWSDMDEDKAAKQARNLKEAMKGAGTDEEELNRIIMGYSREELHDIIEEYPGGAEALIKHIQDDTSGDYEAILVRMVQNAAGDKYNRNEYANENKSTAACAYQIFDAVDGLGTDEEALYEILLDSSDEKLLEIVKYMEENPDDFDNLSLRDMVLDDFSGDAKKALEERFDRLGID